MKDNTATTAADASQTGANDTSGDTIAYGRSIVQHEADAVARLSELLDDNFARAVELILARTLEGRVIVSGMGKAGFIGMKISATLASTGVPSFFLHPAEAVHGDLGRYTSPDISLILSNSGETQEVLRILPHVKRIGCPVISITGSNASTLAKHSDVVIAIGRVQEAGPLGLAPTTSTTVMLALGDALAMTILNRQNLSPEQYACWHPGGALGRSLMLVSELMRTGARHCVVPQSMSTREVIHCISSTEGRPGAASIVNEQGGLVGIFTDGNLRRCMERGNDHFLDLPVEEVMGKNPKTTSPDKLVQEALHILTELKIDQVIVVDDEHRPVGMLDIQDVAVLW